MGYDGYFKLYNGAPNRDLKEYWESKNKARKELDRVAKEYGYESAWCTYFPLEHKYACAAWDAEGKFVDCTGFYDSVEAACAAAIQFITGDQP